MSVTRRAACREECVLVPESSSLTDMSMMAKMVLMAKRTSPSAPLRLNVAEAKLRLSELLATVAFGGATVEITRRGRPMAKLAIAFALLKIMRHCAPSMGRSVYWPEGSGEGRNGTTRPPM